MKTLKSKGFTLIELLVVVAIIGILATVVLSSLSSARERARDAKRLADIRTIQTALEVYYLDNGSYPTTGWSGSHTSTWDTLGTLIGTTLPVDPVNDASNSNSNAASSGNLVYGYFGSTSSNYCNGQAYMLVINLESKNDQSDGLEFCNGFEGYNDAIVAGVDRYGNFVGPGELTAKEN
jgi:general secretion pathway protein G